MPSLLQPSLRQAELKDLLGVLLFFIFLEDGGKCGIGACELRPHPPRAIPLCWSRFRTAEKSEAIVGSEKASVAAKDAQS